MTSLDIELPSKRVAALIDRSIFTLQAARRGDLGVNMPPHVVQGRAVRYVLRDVVTWALRRGIELHWDALPAQQRIDRKLARQLNASARLMQPAKAGLVARQATHPPANRKNGHKFAPARP